MSSKQTKPIDADASPSSPRRARIRRRLQFLSLALAGALTVTGLLGVVRDCLMRHPVRRVDWVETIAGTVGFGVSAWNAYRFHVSARAAENAAAAAKQENSETPHK